MKRVVIICEGETEREFCKTLLAAYFVKRNIHYTSTFNKKVYGWYCKVGHFEERN
jgi:hypothetical protein